MDHQEVTENVPIFLAIETATEVMSAAIYQGEELLAVEDVYIPKSHNRLITVILQQLTEHLDIKINKVACVGISSGPGSYTGLRVGASAAKGFCMGLGIPLISIPTLSGLAQSVIHWAKYLNALIVPMIDARRMEVYCGVYDSEGIEIIAPHARVLTEESILDCLQERKAIFIGDGAAKCKNLYDTDEQLIFMPQILPSARFYGKLIYDSWLNKRYASVFDFEPLYLKEVMIRQSIKK